MLKNYYNSCWISIYSTAWVVTDSLSTRTQQELSISCFLAKSLNLQQKTFPWPDKTINEKKVCGATVLQNFILTSRLFIPLGSLNMMLIGYKKKY